MPKKMLWTELLFSYFPGGEKSVAKQMMARFGFVFAFWLSGLLVYALDGLVTVYLSEQTSLSGYATFFLIFIGSYYVQRTLGDLIQKFRPMLRLNDSQFQKLSERLERYSYSFLPCIFIAIGFALLTGVPSQFQQALFEGLRLHMVWNLFANSFSSLLTATAIWMLASIWLTIFLISREPLNVKLSPETILRFRELSMFALWFSLFYFLGVSIGNISFLVSTPTLSLPEIVVSPYLFFVAIGIVGILFPFYNIHVALLKMKKQELSKISEESERLLQQLDEVLIKQPAKQASDHTITIMARLFSLQIKERNIKAAQEWPIDISFLSKLMIMGLIPIISRIAAMLIIS
ncbi:hypothetical protein KAT21_03275 [Candidatus Bathyarchaeota archaeon]|nr:hypothetical protein [Candidatus Bathyarchaeota archaeon]